VEYEMLMKVLNKHKDMIPSDHNKYRFITYWMLIWPT